MLTRRKALSCCVRAQVQPGSLHRRVVRVCMCLIVNKLVAQSILRFGPCCFYLHAPIATAALVLCSTASHPNLSPLHCVLPQ